MKIKTASKLASSSWTAVPIARGGCVEVVNVLVNVGRVARESHFSRGGTYLHALWSRALTQKLGASALPLLLWPQSVAAV